MDIKECSKMYPLAREALINAGVDTVEKAMTFTVDELMSVEFVGKGTIKLICKVAEENVSDWVNSTLYASIHPKTGVGYYYNLGNGRNFYDCVSLCRVLTDNEEISQLTVTVNGLEFVFDSLSEKSK